MSAIDITKPVTGNPTTQSVRDNFATAASEITALQAGTIPGLAASSGSSLVGFIQSGTGAIARTVQDKLRDTVNALDFGSMTVTPGADINLAIASLGSVGGVVDIPDGSFSVETTILQPSNVVLRGRGIGATKLTAATGLNAPVLKNATAISSQSITGITRTGRTATATKNSHGYSNGTYVFVSGAAQLGYNGVFQIFNVSANTFDFYVEKTTVTPATGTLLVYQAVNSNLAIYDLEIVGNASNTAGNNYGLQYHGVNRFILHNVYAHDTYHTCLVFTSAVNGFLGNVMGDGAINSSHDGLLFGTSNSGPGSGFSYCADIVIQGGSYSGNGQTGVETVAGRGFAFNGVIARRNAVGGFTTSNASQVTFNGCIGEKNVAHGIELYLNTGASDVSVIGGIWRENGESGIFCTQNDTVNPASNITIVGNLCSNNSQVASTVAYGIAIEPTAGATIDVVTITGNTCVNNARGISFGTNGTVTHGIITGNMATGNVSDYNLNSTCLQFLTSIIGPNNGTTGTQQLLMNNGSASAPAYSFASSITDGVALQSAASHQVNLVSNGVVPICYQDIAAGGQGFRICGTNALTFSTAFNVASDLILVRDGQANTIAQKNANADQLNRQYAMNGGYWERGSASELLTLSTIGATTDTAGNLLPANSIIESVVARITTTITTATDWKLGDSTIAGRFTAANATMVAGTTDVGLVHIDLTGTSGPRQTAAAKLRITTTGTPGAGVVRVIVFYRRFVPPTS